MSALEPLLQKAGFTDYEARAYVALVHKSPQTGYELAKTSRIPRGNIYTVLQKLESRGAATRVISPDAVRYTAVAPELVIQRMKSSFLDMMQDMERQIHSISLTSGGTHVESFEGYDNLMFFATQVLTSAQLGVSAALYRDESVELAPVLNNLASSPITVTTLCLNGCPTPCPSCHGERVYGPHAYDTGHRWFVVVGDETHVVAGQIEGDHVTGIRTSLPWIAKMTALFLKQSTMISWLLRTGRLDAETIPKDMWTPAGMAMPDVVQR